MPINKYLKYAVLRDILSSLREVNKQLIEELKKIFMNEKLAPVLGSPPPKGDDYYFKATDFVMNNKKNFPILAQDYISLRFINSLIEEYIHPTIKGPETAPSPINAESIAKAIKDLSNKEKFMKHAKKSVLIRKDLPSSLPSAVEEIDFDKLKPSQTVMEFHQNLNRNILANRIWKGFKDKYRYVFEGGKLKEGPLTEEEQMMLELKCAQMSGKVSSVIPMPKKVMLRYFYS